MRGKKSSENVTIVRLRDTPHKTAAEMNAAEERIAKDEWEIMERARRRQLLLKKEQFRDIAKPYKKGFRARFVGEEHSTSDIDNLVHSYLTEEDSVQIDISEKLNTDDAGSTLTYLVKSVTQSLIDSYMGTTLGLKQDVDYTPKQAVAMADLRSPNPKKEKPKTRRSKK